MSRIRKVAVVGAGNMGCGIAQVAATAGEEVRMIDVSQDLLNRAMERVRWSLDKLAEKKAIHESTETILKRMSCTADLFGGVKDADLIIEAVPEVIEVKAGIFTDVDKAAPCHAILASNTSGLPISILSRATKRPEKFVGTHWMNPPVVMRLIEIVKGEKTNGETMQTITDLCQKVYGKQVVVVKKDVWGFLSGRAHMGWNLGTAYLYHAGEATAEEIDAMARYEMGLPMGPFELADFTGLNELRVGGLGSIKKILKGSPEFEPWEGYLKAFEYITEVISKPMVEKGLTGVKTGEGFYRYPEPGKYRKADVPKNLADRVYPAKALAVAANTSAWCVTNGIGSMEDVDKCFRLAYSWPKGIFEFVKQYGPKNVVEELRRGMDTAPEAMKPIYNPDPLLLNMI